jgi:hypothetical protein
MTHLPLTARLLLYFAAGAAEIVGYASRAAARMAVRTATTR